MHQLVKDALGFGPENQGHLQPKQLRPKPKQKRKRFWPILIAVIVVVLGTGLTLLVTQWPFTRHKVTADLEEALHARVEINKFHQTYFPSPGCVAEDVTVRQNNRPNAVPVTIRKLTIQGSFRGLFTKHVPVLRAEGVHATAENASSLGEWGGGAEENEKPEGAKKKSKTVVDEFVITGSVLEFSHGEKTPGLKFEVAELKLHNSGQNAPLRFEAVLRNPKPPGLLRLGGSVGPWQSGNAGKTPLTGSYILERADLGVFRGIGGKLSSRGTFSGVLKLLEVRGSTETPDFEVKDPGHKLPLNTEFQARVNTRNGDVFLERLMVQLGKSSIAAPGQIAAEQGKKAKSTSLDLAVRSGRIQDFLFLFLDDRVPPMFGSFTFRGKARLPAGKGPFLKRVELEGDFGIADAKLSNPVTQGKLESLSERAEGEKDEPPERVVSDLRGHGVLRGGIATFSDLTFRVPGAKARVHGTYSLVNHRVNLHGRLLTQTTLPKATSGMKSFLLKIISPLLKKNHRGGAVVALSVTGFYPHPNYKTAAVTN